MESMKSTTAEGSTASGVMDRVREGAKSQLSTQKERATDGLGHLAQAVRQSTTAFREHQQDTVANYLEGAADQIERVSARLRERDLNDLMRDAQQFARRQPAVFIGTAFLLGALTARFLKSSNERNRRANGRDRDMLGSRTGAGAYPTNTPGTPRYADRGL